MNQNSSTSDHLSCSQHLVCIFENCMNKKRFLCSQCSIIHQHEQMDQQHIIEMPNFWNLISHKIQSQSIHMKQIKQTLQQINNINPKVMQKELIEKLININSIDEAQIMSIQEQLDLIIKYQMNTDQLINNKQIQKDRQNFQQVKNEDQKIQYESIYFQKSKTSFSPVSCSSNEQYLMFIQRCYQILLMKIQQRKKLAYFCLSHQVLKLRFQNYLLFSADFDGNLSCLTIKPNFKKVRKIKLHCQLLSDLKVIKTDKIITSCFIEKQIIIIDIKSNFILNRIQDPCFVYQIDYDYQNNVIVSLSGGRSIKFFNHQNQMLLDLQRPHKKDLIQYIQLIDNCHNLLSSSLDTIKLWQITYDRQSLIELMQYQNNGLIYNVQSVIQNKYFVIVTKTQVLITDMYFNPIYEIDHQIKYQNDPQYVQNSTIINYILIIGQNQLEIFQRLVN